MCYDGDARPPAPPRVTGSATGTDLLLTAADSNEFRAYLATPEHPADHTVVLLPDVNGLRDFTTEMALRFAETGATTLAIHYFGRTAGSGQRPPDFSSEPHRADLSRENLLLDVTAAIDCLGENFPGPVFANGHQRANVDAWGRLLNFFQQGQPGTPTTYPAAPGPPGVSG